MCNNIYSQTSKNDSNLLEQNNVKAPTIELTAPAINELFAPETECLITWASSEIEYVKLEYSLNNGLNWNTIISSTPSSEKNYNWNLPSNVGRYKLRISDVGNAGTFDEIVFSVGAVYLTSPVGGARVNTESALKIEWNQVEIPKIDILYSIDNGNSYKTIVSNYLTSRLSYFWKFPAGFNEYSDSCRIKIESSQNNEIYDVSDEVFRLYKLSIISPLSGDLFPPDSSLIISWVSAGIDSVNIKTSRDNGITWDLIKSNVKATTDTIILSSITGKIIFKVCDAIDTNAYTQVIGKICKLRLKSPQENNVWKSGNTYEIAWEEDPNISYVNIKYSLDSGNVYENIALNYKSIENNYEWHIPEGISSDRCVIKIESSLNPNIYTTNENLFSIYYLDLYSPFNTVYDEEENVNIEWNVRDIEYIDIEYSYDNGLTWIIIAEYINASIGSYNWFIPDISSEKYLFRISDSENPLKYDQTPFKVTTDVPFSGISFYDNVTPNAENPSNIITLGKPLRFKIMAANNFGENLLTLKGSITSGSPYVTITDNKGSFNNVLQDSAEWSYDEFEVLISEDLPPNHEISFILTIEDEIVDDGPWKSVFSIPFLNISRILIDDDEYKDSDGNGNNRADPGESIELLPLIENKSKISFNKVSGTLHTSDNEISIINGKKLSTDSIYNTAEYGIIPIGVTDVCPLKDFVFINNKSMFDDLNFAFVIEGYTTENVLLKYYCPFILHEGIPDENPNPMELDVYQLLFSRFEFYKNVAPNPSNPENIIGPGETVRFKVKINNLSSNLLGVYGVISTESPYVEISDSTASFNNVPNYNRNQLSGWSDDEFEIRLANEMEKTGKILFKLTLYDGLFNIGPLESYFYIPFPNLQTILIDDDNNPDSDGNNNDIAEPGEIIEIIPVLYNNSVSRIYKLKSKFLPYSDNIEVWNNVAGSNTIVYDTYYYNVINHIQQPVYPGDSTIVPEEDYVFSHIGVDTTSIYFTLLAEGYIDDNPGENWYEKGILMKWGIPGIMNKGYPVDPVTVRIISPRNGESYNNDTAIKILVNANSPVNNVSKIELYIDETLVKSFNSAWASTTIKAEDYSTGSHIIKAIVYDDAENSSYHEVEFHIKEQNNPVVQNPIDNITLNEGFETYEIDFSNVFTDPDGDELAYECYSEDESVVSASISDLSITLTEKGIGSANIVITATDPYALSAYDKFLVSVSDSTNNKPLLVNAIQDMDLEVGFVSFSVDISDVFIDVDGDDLFYSVENDNQDVVKVSIIEDKLLVFEQGIGSANILLLANDRKGGIAENSFDIHVKNITEIDANLSEYIKIYPNPAENNLFIEHTFVVDANAFVEIFDITGTLLVKKELNNRLTRINISKLPNSIYIIRTCIDDQIKITKLVKN